METDLIFIKMQTSNTYIETIAIAFLVYIYLADKRIRDKMERHAAAGSAINKKSLIHKLHPYWQRI